MECIRVLHDAVWQLYFTEPMTKAERVCISCFKYVSHILSLRTSNGWLCAAVCWAMNSQVNESGYSPAQWVLGQGLRLPESLQSGNLALASRLEEDPQFAQRIAIQAAAQKSIVGLRYSRALSRAFLARSRATSTEPVASQIQIGDQVFDWRGINKKGLRPSHWALGEDLVW